MSNTLQIIQQTKVTRRIDLGDFDDAYRGAIFDVWVTPTRAHWAEYLDFVSWVQAEPKRLEAERDAIQDEAERAAFNLEMGQQLDQEMWRRLDGWLAETWLNIEREEVTAIREHLRDTFLEAWQWLYEGTIGAIIEYRESKTKN